PIPQLAGQPTLTPPHSTNRNGSLSCDHRSDDCRQQSCGLSAIGAVSQMPTVVNVLRHCLCACQGETGNCKKKRRDLGGFAQYHCGRTHVCPLRQSLQRHKSALLAPGIGFCYSPRRWRSSLTSTA